MSFDPRFDITESLRKYILRDGVPVTFSRDEWRDWMDSEHGREESDIGGVDIDDVKVATWFNGCSVGPYVKLDESLLFQTSAMQGRSFVVLSRYRSLRSAKIGHKRWVTIMRKRLLGDDGAS